MIFIKLLFAIALPTLSGFSITQMLFARHRLPWPLTAAISYGLGFGLLSQWILILGILKIKFTILSISAPLLALSGLLLLLHRAMKKPKVSGEEKTVSPQKWSAIDFILMTFISFNLIDIFWRGLNIPVYEWDSLSTHAFNAKVLFYERSLALHKNFPHEIYPLHIPFIQMWITICLGFWDDQWIKLIFPITCLSFLIIQYYFVKHFSDRRWALIGIALLLSSNFFTFHAASTYRDFTMMYYHCATIIFLLFWLQSQRDSWLYLAGVFSGFTTFIKQEGIGYLILHAILCIFIIRVVKQLRLPERFKLFLKFLLPGSAVALIYILYKKFILLPQLPSVTPGTLNFDINNLAISFGGEQFSRVLIVLWRFAEDLFLTGNWSLIWPLLGVSLLSLIGQKIRQEVKILLIGLIFYFTVYAIGFAFTQHYTWIADGYTAASRCVLHFFPLAVLLIIFILAPAKSRQE